MLCNYEYVYLEHLNLTRRHRDVALSYRQVCFTKSLLIKNLIMIITTTRNMIIILIVFLLLLLLLSSLLLLLLLLLLLVFHLFTLHNATYIQLSTIKRHTTLRWYCFPCCKHLSICFLSESASVTQSSLVCNRENQLLLPWRWLLLAWNLNDDLKSELMRINTS